MNKSKVMNRKIFMISAVAAVLLIAAATQVYAAANIHSLAKVRKENAVSFTATANSDAEVRTQPQPLSIPAAKISQGEKIEVLSEGKNWCKVVIYTDKKVKTGYVKTSSLSELTESEICAAIITAPKNMTVAVGETTVADIETVPYYANEKLIWSSSDESVVTTENGSLVPVNAGNATVTVKGANCSAEISVKVVENTQNLSFKSPHFTIDENSEINLGNYLETDGKTVKWNSSDSDCVSVKDGKINAKEEGFSNITAVSGNKSAECTIEVRSVNGNAKSELKILNSYGNYINYHPSVLYFKDGWNGYKYWIAYTPYEHCDDYWENPHMAASNDLVNWVTPSGFSNPLEPVPSDYKHGISYNSDTELVYNKDTGRLECWWRYYDYRNLKVSLRRKTTSDGVHWSEKEDMLVSDNLNNYDFLSPALLYEDGKYKMWSINLKSNYDIEYRESTDGKNWSAIQKIKVEYEDPKYINWHLDVIHTPKGYEMDISAYLKGTRDRTVMSLFYTYSPDNVTYTKVRPMLHPRKNTDKWDNKGLYRSCLLYADGKYYLFYSGINKKKGPVGIGLISGNDVFHMQ